MNEILKYFVKSLANFTLSLNKRGILIDKPWALIDNDGEVQKLIFKRDKGLIFSKNGKVTEGFWDYYPEAKALLIDRIKDKLLLKEQFIDDNVLILKKDGTDNEFFVLSNENSLPDYNIPKYLNSLKCKEFKIEERKLLNGNILQIYNGTKIKYLQNYSRHVVEQIDPKYNSIDLTDGTYLTENRKFTFYIKNGRITSVRRNLLVELTESNFFEIENGSIENINNNINKKVSINGKSIPDTRLIDFDNIIYEIKESIISKMYFITEYELNNDIKIKIEQSDFSKITKGDKIFESTPISPLPDGTYKVKGMWKRIKVVNNIII